MEANYEVENEQIKKLMTDIGQILKGAMPAGWGFTLLIFSYGEEGSMFYLSSAQRKDMLKALEEFKQKVYGG